jgi:hypothetical protein
MCDGEKIGKAMAAGVCSAAAVCEKRGCLWLSQMLGVCESKHTKNLNGDLGRYAAPAVPAMKTLLGRNRCPLAGFRIGKFEIGSVQNVDWLSRNGERINDKKKNKHD